MNAEAFAPCNSDGVDLLTGWHPQLLKALDSPARGGIIGEE
jgi:hypothetical protein